MIKKSILVFLLPFLLSFYSPWVFAQDTLPLLGRMGDPAIHSSRIKAKQLIIPGAFLVYGGLKPVINDISKLDDKIWTHVQNRYPDFHTNAADYLMWVPSASIYAMDAFHVKTQHTFKEHLILDVGSILVTGGLAFGIDRKSVM